MVPSRLVLTVETSRASSMTPAASSICMIPALLIRTLSFGYCAMSFFATEAMLFGS